MIYQLILFTNKKESQTWLLSKLNISMSIRENYFVSFALLVYNQSSPLVLDGQSGTRVHDPEGVPVHV